MTDKRILHLGLGSFHRAHQAAYLQRLHDLGQREWRLAAGNIRGDMMAVEHALIAQQGAYTLETISPRGERHYQRITAIDEVIPYSPALQGLIDAGANPHTRIISFTVTEAGYYLDAQHRLDSGFADLASDLRGHSHKTIYGAMAAILAARKERHGGPVTLLNCDNLRSNGDRFRGGFLDFLNRRGEDELHAWVTLHAPTPNSMVDRITPRPLPAVAQRVRQATGRDDEAPVMAESFSQWVIEDQFAAGRPRWEDVGVEFVDSVLPFEEAKIRILNASHSCIAWAGTLIGLQYIHEGVAEPAIRAMAHRYVTDDVIPSLTRNTSVYPIDLAGYRDAVLERFSSPYLLDTNQRVAMDAFSKIPGFILPTIRERIVDDADFSATALLPALFFLYLERWAKGAISYTYEDQAMDAESARAIVASRDPIHAFAGNPVLWQEMAGHERLEAALREALPVARNFVATYEHA